MRDTLYAGHAIVSACFTHFTDRVSQSAAAAGPVLTWGPFSNGMGVISRCER
jgi:hypothetical protein